MAGEGIVTVSEDLASMGVFLGYAVVRGSSALKYPGELEKLVSEAEETVRRRYSSLADVTGDRVVRAYRSLMWRLGMDPTKTRPSGEALVRRIVSGRGLPRINCIVDCGNVASALTLVPIGIYDFDRVTPPLSLVRIPDYADFKPIGGGREKLAPKTPVLLDSGGLVVHVYPHRDSVESMVREETRNLLIIGAGSPGVDRDLVYDSLYKTVDCIKRHCGGELALGVEVSPRY